MSIVSFKFIIFLLASVILYYLIPKKHRWPVLLLSSIVFFVSACNYKLLLYLIFDVLVAYFGTKFICNSKSEKKKKTYYLITIFLIIGVLFTLKWFNIFPLTINGFAELFNININVGMLNIVAPLGISYYTLSLIGYVTDIYRSAYEREKNIFKLSLFTCYYPVLVSGPFIRFDQMKKELFEEKCFSYQNIFFGMERIIYGLMKKVLIADLLSSYVQAIFASYTTYSGYFIIIGLVFYAIQIYCDFSGCMDIVIGASKMYGITLVENFNSPFMSKNLSEFWRKWHISLGQWGKDYIMYPLLKSNMFQKYGNKLRNKFGKKLGKKFTTLTAVLVLWLFIGIWHGASYRYIFCAGILPWIYLSCGELFEDLIEKINNKLKIRTDCFSFAVFRRIRTLGFMCFVWLFACSPSLRGSLSVIKNIFILPDSSLFQSLPQLPWVTILIAISLVFIVDYLKYKEINVLELFSKQNTIFKYFIIFMIIYLILKHGAYGPGFNPADFIYGGF